MAVKKPIKYTGIAIVVLLVAFLGWRITQSSKKVGDSQSIGATSLSSTAESSLTKTTDNKLPLPSFNSPVGTGTQLTWQVMAWNSQFPLMYANGGVRTSKGSLMEKAGVDITIVRQDDCNKTIQDFIANANELKNNPAAKPMIISFMGDGVPGFSVALKQISDKLGKEYQPIVFYFMGRSNGEDGFWGPISWKQNPKNALGKSVAGVERDGDLNIVFKWAGDNGLKVNANTTVWDSNAINIIPCSDFIQAGDKYINGFTEERVVMRNGKTYPSEPKHTVTCDAYTSWTPVDVTVAEKKGGLIRIASTKEYTAQMPNASIILKSWANNHRTDVENIVKALGQAGDQVRSFSEAQEFAAKVSAVVYGDKDKDGDYWLKYYRGVETKDATGMRVSLGGSQAFNLADAANTVGLGTDHIDRYKVTYETFGNILAKLYPAEMAGWEPYSQIVDKSFINAVMANNSELGSQATEESQQNYTQDITSEVASKPYNIQFTLGSSTINSSSYAMLDEIYKSAVLSGGLSIGVYGHTDNIGNPSSNQILSEQRAQAVANYLINKGLRSTRIKVIGKGEGAPLDGTSGPSDPANRCVEIVQGT